MPPYLRPSIDASMFRDDDGQFIDYGNRWEGTPPEESYSVVAHPERFAPIHTVADALVAYLRDAYDVELLEGEEAAADLIRPAPTVIRAVRIRPDDPACAALTFVYTAFPGIFLHAGVLHDFHYPVCGCDACDSTWGAEADDLERTVLAVVSGHYREAIDRGPLPWVDYSLTYPDGVSSGRSRADEFPAERLSAAAPILRNRLDAWAAWPFAASGSRTARPGRAAEGGISS